MALIEIDQKKLESARAALSEIKGGIETVLMRSINRAVSAASTQAAKGISEELNLKQSIIKQDFHTTMARVKTPTGRFRSIGKPQPLINYGARQTKTGVSVIVKKGRPRQTIPETFIATMKSGHQGVFRRKYERGTGKPIGNKGNMFLNQPARWPKEYRLPIEEMFGPRVEDILSNDSVMNPVLEVAGKTINDRLEHETEYYLEKARNV